MGEGTQHLSAGVASKVRWARGVAGPCELVRPNWVGVGSGGGGDGRGAQP